MGNNVAASLRNYTWVPPLLSHVEDYDFYLSVASLRDGSALENFDFVLRNMQQLETLQISACPVDGPDVPGEPSYTSISICPRRIPGPASTKSQT
jgi:hypothetical protein